MYFSDIDCSVYNISRKEKRIKKNERKSRAEKHYMRPSCNLFFIVVCFSSGCTTTTVSRIDDSHMTVKVTGVLSLFICPLRPSYSLPTYSTFIKLHFLGKHTRVANMV